MIIGDPFYFAMQFDKVECWNASDNFWENGLFFCYIDGKRVFDFIDVFELKTTYSFYLQAWENIKSTPSIPNEFTYIDLFKNATNYFVEDHEYLIDGIVNLTCTVMSDNDFFIFFCKRNDGDQIIWSNDGIVIQQFMLPENFILSQAQMLAVVQLVE